MGRLVAASLSSSPNPPPTTLLVRQHTYDTLRRHNDAIRLTRDGVTRNFTNFSTELLASRDGSRGNDEPIRHLILSTKATQSVDALRPLKHRLGAQSVILLLQNGMGTFEALNRHVFPELESRPTYMAGISSHGLHSVDAVSSIHAGVGETYLGFPHGSGSDEAVRPFLQALLAASMLVPSYVEPMELLQRQLEKLIVNSVINPLTAIQGVANGQVLAASASRGVAGALIHEATQIVQSLPELHAVRGVQERFSRQRLMGLVEAVAEKTAGNLSSMLQDVRRGVETEVRSINGYLVDRAKEVGAGCELNEEMVNAVEERLRLSSMYEQET